MSDDETDSVSHILELQYQAECIKIEKEILKDTITHMIIDIKIELCEYVQRHGLPFLQYFDMEEWVVMSTAD